MGRKRRYLSEAAAHARAGRRSTSTIIEYEPEDPRYEYETHWTGGVNHELSDCESQWETSHEPTTGTTLGTGNSAGDISDSDPELRLEPLEDDASLANCFAQEEKRQAELWRLPSLNMSLSGKGWKKAETNRGLGYNKHTESTLHKHAQKTRE
ncbi:hypothetical protein C8J57DRAFT_1235849 [Mycena rebaudengoi]|nr:hypothetical protein C8J57DRAFT_1235849 [Mycena rebaudengoi]